MSTFGVASINDSYTDVSSTERGAKNYATRHGYKEVYIRHNNGYYVELVSTKINNIWVNTVGNF
jgi:hypothetical protein